MKKFSDSTGICLHYSDIRYYLSINIEIVIVIVMIKYWGRGGHFTLLIRF